MTMRKSAILFILIFLLPAHALTQPFGFPQPAKTKLVEKDKSVSDRKVTTTYRRYQSQLPPQRVITFYRRMFNKQGFKEEGTSREIDPQKNDFTFKKENKKIFLTIIPFSDESCGYTINIVDTPSLKETGLPPGFPNYNFSHPQKLKIMPVYPDSKEFKNEKHPVALAFGYLTPSPAEEVSDFYLKNMPEYGWSMVSNESNQGSYKLSEWVKIVAPYTKFLLASGCKELEVMLPSLSIRGKTLKFENGMKGCELTVYTFEDIITNLKHMEFDLSPIEQYGNTVIGVAYFYDKNRTR